MTASRHESGDDVKDQRNDALGQSEADWLKICLQRVAQGDSSVLAPLMHKLNPRLLQIAYGITQDRADAEEIVNDLWRQVWKHAAKYDASRSPPHGWLVAIVKRLAIDALRRRESRIRAETLESNGDGIDHRTNPASTMAAQEQLSLLQQALFNLTTRRRTVARMVLVEQKSQSEIARQTDTPLGTVKTRMREALRALRAALTR